MFNFLGITIGLQQLGLISDPVIEAITRLDFGDGFRT